MIRCWERGWGRPRPSLFSLRNKRVGAMPSSAPLPAKKRSRPFLNPPLVKVGPAFPAKRKEGLRVWWGTALQAGPPSFRFAGRSAVKVLFPGCFGPLRALRGPNSGFAALVRALNATKLRWTLSCPLRSPPRRGLLALRHPPLLWLGPRPSLVGEQSRPRP